MKRHASGRAPRIVLAVTSAQSLKLMTGFPQHLVESGWDVHVVAGSRPSTPLPAGVSFHELPMVREPSPFRDLASLWWWVSLLLRLRPRLVVAGTPKAGLLGMLASFLTRVPGRVYLLRGLRLETLSGPKRRALWVMEWISARAATKVQSVSHSLRQEFIVNRLCAPARIVVLGGGSSNGVEIIEASALPEVDVENVGLKRNVPVIGYVGRLTKDKGLSTLLSAVRKLKQDGIEIQVLLVGPEEPAGSLAEALSESGLARDGVCWAGAVPDARPYYRIMDLLCLPTRREGFPNVVLEAAVQGVPAFVSDATGAVDSVVDGETGWLFRVADSEDLAERLLPVLRDPGCRARAGTAARQRVVDEFDRTIVWAQTDKFFRREAGVSDKERELI